MPHETVLVVDDNKEIVAALTDVLDDPAVRRIFGIHVWPLAPTATITSRAGTFLAACSNFTISRTMRLKSAPIRGSQPSAFACNSGISELPGNLKWFTS